MGKIASRLPQYMQGMITGIDMMEISSVIAIAYLYFLCIGSSPIGDYFHGVETVVNVILHDLDLLVHILL